MSQAGPAPSQKLVTELKVSGHLMTLEQGLFCVFHAPGGAGADPQTGLPGVRITHPPSQERSRLTITSFSEDGWIGAEGSAALVRVNQGPSQLLVTIYQNGNGQYEAPKLQVMRIGGVAAPVASAPSAEALPAVAAGTDAAPAPAPAAEAAPKAPDSAEVAAHVQRRGDKLGKLGDWMGEPGSQSWIEGFAIAPNRMIGPEDIEYQAVLGKGWLSPWSEGGQYCGSRGMALPILGLRVRLKGKAAETHTLRVSATFTDGTKIGPLPDSETAEAESLAPLEAFRIEISSQSDADLESDAGAEPQAEAEKPAALKPRAAIKPLPGRRGASTAPQPAITATAAKSLAGKAVAGKAVAAKTVAARTVAARTEAKVIPKPAGKQAGHNPGRPVRR